MHSDFDAVVMLVGRGVEAGGIAVIVLGMLLALARFAGRLVSRAVPFPAAYRDCRQGLGRALLLGLELLVAADIIRTVATSPTFYGVGVLAIIIAIRTFLSLSLQLEIEGRLPWNLRRAEAGPTHAET